MKKLKLIWTKGLPGAGKSSWAKAFAKESKERWVVVSLDPIREMLHNGKFSRENEKECKRASNVMISEFLRKGINVIVDNTHLPAKYVDHFNEYADKNVEVSCKDFTDVFITICLERNEKREKSVPSQQIWRMWEQFIRKPEKSFGESYKSCVLIDLDGTVAIKGNRSPYDLTRVIEDDPNNYVINMISRFVHESYAPKHIPVFVSGREDVCRDDTLSWLKKYVHFFSDTTELFMRKAGDTRPDYVVKREIYNKFIEPYYNVEAVFDDRLQTCTMWREEGLPVFQVDQGNF